MDSLFCNKTDKTDVIQFSSKLNQNSDVPNSRIFNVIFSLTNEEFNCY